jgi:ferrous iron transport protein B
MHSHAATKHACDDGPIVLVGHPNVGKSVLFGALTGRYVEVSNFPGTTVEVSTGSVRLPSANGNSDGQALRLIDTPGIQSLHARSDDERVTRDILLGQTPRVVVQVADARNMRRGLLLTLQLAELGLPFILDVNMGDEARARGIRLNTQRLAQALGAEVVETVAVRRQGIEDLRARIAVPKPIGYRIHYDGAIEAGLARLQALLPDGLPGLRAISLMMLAGDEEITHRFAAERAAEARDIAAEVSGGYSQPLSYVIATQRLRCADCLLPQLLRQGVPPEANAWQRVVHRFAGLFGRLAVHPVWGWPILGLVLAGMYLFVGIFGAGTLVGWMEEVLFASWILPPLSTWIGRLPIALVVDLLVGEYGLISMALTYGLAIVMPIVFTFFVAFGLLEDSGYLPRLAVMMDRPFRAMGLNGKAVLPMVLGLGCDTMATLTTRILDTRKDRVLVTLLLALGVPCSAQLGVLLGMLAFLSPGAVLVWGLVVAAIMFVVGWLAARLIPGKRSDFILELPPMRVPQLSNIVIKTLARLEWYLKEVLPLFVLGTLVLFVLDRVGGLALLERWAAPLVQVGLGLPAQATEAFIIGFLRRDYGAAGLFVLARAGELDALQLLVSLVVITLFVPCIANVMVIAREHGWKTMVGVVASVFPLAFGVGIALNWLLRFLAGWLT